MRSHFRADFYAKAVVLMALSGLAAAGVAIDNWPAPTRMPDIGFGPPQLRTPVVQTFEEVAALSFTSMDVIPVTTGPRRIAPRPLPKARWSASFRHTIPAVRPIDPMPLPAPVESLVVILPNPVLQLADVPEFDADSAAGDDETWQPLQAPATLAQAEEEGFFSGAIRKTSASLDKAKTSLVDAVRAVGGAVRILKR